MKNHQYLRHPENCLHITQLAGTNFFVRGFNFAKEHELPI